MILSEKTIFELIRNDEELFCLCAQKLDIKKEELKDFLDGKSGVNLIKNISPIEKTLTSTYKMFIDGGSRGNPGISGSGVVLIDTEMKKNGYYFYNGNTTNNVAEYTALIKGLELAGSKDIKKINVYTDSELLCKQVNGEYKVKSENLQPLYEEVIKLVKNFDIFKIMHVRREYNKDADKMANLAMDLKKNGEMELTVAS